MGIEDKLKRMSGLEGRENNENNLKIDREKVLSLIHISEPTRQEAISYAVFCL